MIRPYTDTLTLSFLEPSKASKFGFRFGNIGTHTSRTIMLAELQETLSAIPPERNQEQYAQAIIEDNILAKSTASTRKLTHQRLRELYALDPSVPLFRILRRCWEIDTVGRPLLALLCALARDPLLRATAIPVINMSPGTELAKQQLKDALRSAVGSRLNDSILDKVVRNASSSWTQSGHLRGRSRKIRQRVSPTPIVIAYALLLGYLLGLRGQRLFHTLWTSVLDVSPEELLLLAADAKRLGVLDLKWGGDVIEVGFSNILTHEEREMSYGAN